MRGSVRSEADAKRLQAEFGDFFTPLILDVTDAAAVRRAAAEVRGLMKGRTLLGLVNNAGAPLARHHPIVPAPGGWNGCDTSFLPACLHGEGTPTQGSMQATSWLLEDIQQQVSSRLCLSYAMWGTWCVLVRLSVDLQPVSRSETGHCSRDRHPHRPGGPCGCAPGEGQAAAGGQRGGAGLCHTGKGLRSPGED